MSPAAPVPAAAAPDDGLRELLRRVRRIELRARNAVGDLAAGAYRSRFRGQGMEFDRVREYDLGDDLRSIDWNVTARAGRPFVKVFREERELSLMLLVDVSGSMRFGGLDGNSRAKHLTAAETAAIVAVTALRNADRVGLVAFSDRTELHLPARKGRNHVLRLVREILAARGGGRRTDVGHALDELERVHRRRAVVFLISDFLEPHPDLARVLQRSRRRHDLIGLRIGDPAELRLPATRGVLRLRDPEGGGLRTLALDPAGAARYARMMDGHRSEVATAFRAAGCDLVDIATDLDAMGALRSFFLRRRRQVRG
jgi:uncharacterized protein (DUF58 family)